MRKNIASVIDAFHNEESYSDRTCRTNGQVIYSYNMTIAVRVGRTVYVLDTAESPSTATSSHINSVRSALPGALVVSAKQMEGRLDALHAKKRAGQPAVH